MFMHTMAVGALQCNCTVLGCEKTKEAIIIDPGEEAPKILKTIETSGFKVKYLIHTHAHFDHVGATKSLHRKTGAPICLHQEDALLYENLPLQGNLFGVSLEEGDPINHFLLDEEELSFGSHTIKVLHTPGHTPGSICFRVLNAPLLFSGDTLFQSSIGRTDLWGGDFNTIVSSIKNRIYTLEDEIEVIPGHGPNTLIGKEKKYNPFVTG